MIAVSLQIEVVTSVKGLSCALLTSAVILQEVEI